MGGSMRLVHTCSNLNWNLLEGEDPEQLLRVREKPFDRKCSESIWVNSHQLATLCEACSYWYSWRGWRSSGPPEMAYDLLKREFGTMTGLVGHSLEAYTVQDIVYGINHALSEAGIPFGLFDPRYREHPWHLRQERLGEANILKHFHAQESNFLQRKREHDNNPNARDKDDPWTYFRDHQERSFVPARDLPAAYLVLGCTLDSHTSLSFRFLPAHMYDLYPEFFAGRSIKQANGNEYKPEVHLTPAQEASFFEILWKHIEQDLIGHALFKDAGSIMDKSMPQVNHLGMMQ